MRVAAPPLLEVRDLHTAFVTPHGPILAASGVSFSLGAGETKGLVGESGSGKSITLLLAARSRAGAGPRDRR